MPKHTLQFPYNQFRGRILDTIAPTGLVLFDTPKAGNVSRRYVTPTNPNTTIQSAFRTYLAQAAQGYKALSVSEAAAWASAASAITKTDVLGVDYTLTGVGLYVRVNSMRLANGQSLVDVPPTDAPPSGTLTVSELAATGTPASIIATIMVSGISDDAIGFLRIARNLGSEARNARDNEMRAQATTVTQNFATVTGGLLVYSMTALATDPTAVERVGLSVQIMSANYIPGTLHIERNRAMTYSAS